ncbi:MFS transporter [Pengzhenrongella sicca]|uniref:MFS transporter n=1 Tax=Pengzhenrongella sicca TaxID=2819238 RepID=A0A8A4ZDU2_9MICO|nr:MFS transporter [Pengzhenrongella sicca]QTE30132.1 MFS transporter [Pengzhenrongella sicca]
MTVHPGVATPSLQTPGRLRALLVVLCAALALVVAGNSALAIALPDVARALGADQGELTWIIDAYALTFAALLLPAGIAADRAGRRNLLIGGLLVFGGAGIASAFAPDPAWLIGLRALAGVGAAAVFPVTLSALVDAYPESRRGFAVAVWSGVSAAGAVAGTIVAGLLLEAFWWGSIQIAFGVAALALVPAVAVLVAQRRDPTLSLDPLGAAWAVVALAGLVYGVIEAPQRGWGDPTTIAALGVGALALAGFVRHELRSAAPALDVRLFRNRGLAAGSLLVSLQFFASLALFVLAPQYLQLVRGLSPLEAALALLVIGLGVGAGTALAPSALRRVGARIPGTGGLLAMAAGFVLLAAALGRADAPGQLASPWLLAAGLLVFGAGFGLAVTPGTVLILEGLPAERRSVASAVNDITREVGGVLGIAVLSSALISTYRAEIAPALGSIPADAAGPTSAGAAAALGVAADLGDQGAALADAARAAFAAGVGTALWLGAAILAAAAITTWFLAPRR